MTKRFEAKAVLSDPVEPPFSGIPEQGPDVSDDERLKPGDAVVLVGQRDEAQNGPWFIAEGAWSRSLEDVEAATGRAIIESGEGGADGR
ncbi:hypothetical protein [Sorangium sp. So ce388]|uniref:hypothetical protein n=1 Tax=Sorangium sp. So ce388 TaxID=3133309 RepID=UPI003F5B24B2